MKGAQMTEPLPSPPKERRRCDVHSQLDNTWNGEVPTYENTGPTTNVTLSRKTLGSPHFLLKAFIDTHAAYVGLWRRSILNKFEIMNTKERPIFSRCHEWPNAAIHDNQAPNSEIDLLTAR